MPKFTAEANPDILKLRWTGDDEQDHESFQLWRRMVILHASSNNRGQIMRGLLDEESEVHEAQAAATFLGIVCAGGAMRAIVEECTIPHDGFTMFQNITKHYEDHYKPLAHRAAIAYFNVPDHNGMTLGEYSVKVTRTLRRLQAADPTQFTDVKFLENILTTGEDRVVRTPPEVTPSMRAHWHLRIRDAHRARLDHAAGAVPQEAAGEPAQETTGQTPVTPPPPNFYTGITVSAFFDYVRTLRTLNPATPTSTQRIMSVGARTSPQRPTRPCWHWVNKGNCSYAGRCRFAHPPASSTRSGGAPRDTRGKGRFTHRNPEFRSRQLRYNRSATARPSVLNPDTSKQELCINHICGRCRGKCPRIHISMDTILRQHKATDAPIQSASTDVTSEIDRMDISDDVDTIRDDARKYFSQ
eukprot:m.75725 g.75725  ORF g.75725 m.75725 type:complete len:413 (+) comp16183_c0_seq2:3741-4979(+)